MIVAILLGIVAICHSLIRLGAHNLLNTKKERIGQQRANIKVPLGLLVHLILRMPIAERRG